MKKQYQNARYYFVSLVAIAFLLLVNGCSKDSTTAPPSVNESEILVQYLEANGDYLNTGLPAITTASDVKTQITADPTKYLIIDVRDSTVYKNGHIPGAINKTIPTVLDYLKSINTTNYTKIVLTCYTGQSAGYTVALLRLLGYSNVYSLKWGMCSWDSAFAASYWPKKISNAKASQFITDTIAKPAVGSLPALSTGLTDGKSILEKRVSDLLAAGYNIAVTADQVFSDYASDPAKNFVINYWTSAQYKEVGHVPGAYQYTPKADLKLSTFLKTLPTTKPVVVYCFTGQTSAQLAAVLKVIGYDAKSLAYGANGMIYDLMASKTGYSLWKASECMNYPTEKN